MLKKIITILLLYAHVYHMDFIEDVSFNITAPQHRVKHLEAFHAAILLSDEILTLR